MLERLNSFWSGKRLGYLEQLCLVSAVTVGHRFTLYTYHPRDLEGVPDGIDVRDAREVMAESKFQAHRSSGSVQLGADFFRYALLGKSVGYWVDMDFCFLKPLDFREPYVFGWEYEDNVAGWHTNTINNGVLRVPAQSDMLRDLCELPKTNWRPRWFGPKRTVLYYFARLTKGDVRVEDLPSGTFGPELVTYLAKKYGVAEQAQKPWIFYPVRYKDAPALLGPADAIEKMLTPETRAVHMYQSRLTGFLDAPPPRGSYLDVVCRRYGIDTGDTVSD